MLVNSLHKIKNSTSTRRAKNDKLCDGNKKSQISSNNNKTMMQFVLREVKCGVNKKYGKITLPLILSFNNNNT